MSKNTEKDRRILQVRHTPIALGFFVKRFIGPEK